MIEDVLQRAWRDKLIELEKSKLDFNFPSIKKPWSIGGTRLLTKEVVKLFV